MGFISYAQNCEDVILWRVLKNVEKGFYIDVGANDPNQDSVTKAFYERGWNGINIEPVAHWCEKLRGERARDINLEVALGAEEGEIKLFEIPNTGLSTSIENYAQRHEVESGYLANEIIVPLKTLSSVLIEYDISEVHFLKIDVEGSEEAVLRGTDLSKVRPWIILIEATKPQTQVPDYVQWEDLLVNNDYHFVYFDGINRFYLSAEHSDLAEAFSAPPNPWDGYEHISSYSARQSIQSITSERDNLVTKNKELLDKLAHQQASYYALESLLNKIMSSRSMKMTAPLRRANELVKQAKKLPTELSYRLLNLVKSYPPTRRIGKSLLHRNPDAARQILNLLSLGTYYQSSSNDQLLEKDMSPEAMRILLDIERVLGKNSDLESPTHSID